MVNLYFLKVPMLFELNAIEIITQETSIMKLFITMIIFIAYVPSINQEKFINFLVMVAKIFSE